MSLAGPGDYLFPGSKNACGYRKTMKKVWCATLKKAELPYFRIYDLRSTYGVDDETGIRG
jgi:hypothetical protein